MAHPAPIFSALATDRGRRALVQPVSIERRSKVRFPLELQVWYCTLERGTPFAAVGEVVNISSSGALIAHSYAITAGARVELKIEWPSPLDGRVPLQLVTVGKVVRCGASCFAVVFDWYQFRTAAKSTDWIDRASVRIPAPRRRKTLRAPESKESSRSKLR